MNDTQNRRGPASDPGEQYRETIFSFKTCFAPTLGVALLGLGAGAIAAPFLKSSAPLIALLGLTIYLIGLTHTARSKPDRKSAQPYWLAAIYWSCWIILAVLAFTLVFTWL
ncbi:MAG TPA: hypothetical protein DHV57_15440 [Hyphomonas sp.]|uniref:hypothetical protein n=1 Tax=uncultured Hyphomonas sp. TaxID=225298 RepID=UPI000C54F810|nr:hypothetical protein [Hyphomonas sp.]MAN91637.1 hypothetical protein [Hyphomonadaceae bacterium]HBL93779.1 hypothetical protein [Hyphomonas sp.]HCJ18801.1 hypothetical protein [Hyphomonas sp.]|tara:strand:- start:54574 stop:54906 length:333 start_codon:yes stop_codon:yes gene_type:complete